MELSILPHFGRQIELGNAARKAHLLDTESGDLKDLLGNILEDEHHLEQRRSMGGTLRDKILDQFLEGHILMHVRFQGKRADTANQITKAEVAREVRAEDKRVHEQSNHFFNFDMVSRRNRRPDKNAFLMGV